MARGRTSKPRAVWRPTHTALGASLVVTAAATLAGAGCDTGDPAAPDNPPGRAVAAPPNVPAGDETTSNCIEPACLNIALPPSPHAVRLTHVQWENTVRDLLRLPAAPGLSMSFPADPVPPAGQFGSDGGSRIVSGALWHEYQRAAEALADLVVSDSAAVARLLPTEAKAGDTATRVRAFATDFLPRAWRRPVTPAEVDALVALGNDVTASDATSDPFLLRVRWILVATLQSPFFLYRVEAGDGPITSEGRARLGPYELASKLSYALWGTMPDATLTNDAAAGVLDTNVGVATVVKEMLSDARLVPVLEEFHDALFTVDAFASVTRQTTLFPSYYDAFGKDAQEDLRRTIRDSVIEHDGGVAALYGGKGAYVNASLARVYGIDPAAVPGLSANPAQFVKIDMPSPRVGVLGHVGWLAMQGKQKDPATILRGVYLARHVLCLSLGSPPPAAAGKDPSQIAAPTNRERVAGITAGCGDGCHGGPGGIINPLGFAFEEFDALGAFRTKDGDSPVDTTGTLEQVGDFADAGELMTMASTNARTHACYAAHWSAYLNGLTEVKVSPRWLSPIIEQSMKGASVREIIAELVQQDAFVTVSR